jgi:cation transporter-like permease
MVWYLSAPWDRIITGITLVVLAAFLFWQHLGNYERIYFPSRAVWQAAVKTAYWLVCYAVSFGAVYYGVSHFMAPGGLRYLVGAAIWWTVASILNEVVWKPVSRAIDKLLG